MFFPLNLDFLLWFWWVDGVAIHHLTWCECSRGFSCLVSLPLWLRIDMTTGAEEQKNTKYI